MGFYGLSVWEDASFHFLFLFGRGEEGLGVSTFRVRVKVLTVQGFNGVSGFHGFGGFDTQRIVYDMDASTSTGVGAVIGSGP